MDDKKRQLLYRAKHRGTKELDILLGRYAERNVEAMNEADMALFTEFLEEQEPVMYDWFMEKAQPPAKYAALVKAILFNQRQYI
ncbi:MAG: succinate dehydrogenase assembly factor 2 [Alphaproteobacteria bacterium]|nr:succinate dehydrogenase assembly factor 2 [Alphaproteobacteria bacterium]